MFIDGLLNEELFWLSFGDVISTLVISTVIIAQIGFVVWLLMKWFSKNIKLNWSPVLNIEESGRRRSDSSIEKGELAGMLDNLPPKDMGPIEVDIKKSMVMDTKSDESSVKLDEKIKGKVKTQKDKLRNLRK